MPPRRALLSHCVQSPGTRIEFDHRIQRADVGPHGLRITDILKTRGQERHILDPAVLQRASEVLRFLTNVADPFRGESACSQTLDTQIHLELTLELQMELRAAHDILTTAHSGIFEASDLETTGQTTILLARIIQFTLGLPSLWTQQSRLSATATCALIADLLMVRACSEVAVRLTKISFSFTAPDKP